MTFYSFSSLEYYELNKTLHAHFQKWLLLNNIICDCQSITSTETLIKASELSTACTTMMVCVNTSGKASAQILHLPLGDDSSPSGDNAVGI
jgi:hypothetical protein